MLSGNAPEPSSAPGGIADRLDDLLLRVENWRHRGPVSALLIIVVGGMIGAGWWFGPRGSSVAVEDSIPIVAAGASSRSDAQSEGGPASPTGATPAGDNGSAAAAPVERGDGTTGAGAGPGSAPTSTTAAPPSTIVVHVSGAVVRPGLVELGDGARIADAIEAAGGPQATADIHRLNLAAVLADGTQVVVPDVGAVDDEPLVRLSSAPAGADQGGAGAGAGPVNINTADASALETLPGIGPATSAAIIRWRDENGPFLAVDELLDVPGIGPAKLSALTDLVTL